MSKVVRKEWEQYLFEDGRDYTLEEAMEKVKNATMFLKNKCIRITENLLLDNEQFKLDFHLSETEKELYVKEFNKDGYSIPDCMTIIEVMDAIYHTFEVTKDLAFEMAKYAANNHLTLTQTIYDKLNIDFDEVKEFMDTVFPEILKYFIRKTVKHGRRELREMINAILSSLE